MINKRLFFSRWLLAAAFNIQIAAAQQNGHALVSEVEAVGMTVSDMDRALDFYTKVLAFEKVSEVEVFGEEYEHLQGMHWCKIQVLSIGFNLSAGDKAFKLFSTAQPPPLQK
jgi:hypothetical protein